MVLGDPRTDPTILNRRRVEPGALYQRAAPAANTAATVTLAARANGINAFWGIAWSYDVAPTGGRITVADGATLIFDVDVASGGTGYLPVGFKNRAINSALVVTLAAAGAAVSGKLNLMDVWAERS